MLNIELNDVMFIYLGIFITLSLYHLLVYLGRKDDLSNFAYFLYGTSLIIMFLFTRIFLFFSDVINKLIAIYSSMLVAISLTFFLSTVINLKRVKKMIFIGLISFVGIGIFSSIIFLLFRDLRAKMIYNIAGAIFIVYFACFATIEIIRLKQYRLRKEFIIIIGFLLILLSCLSMTLFSSFNKLSPFFISYSSFLIMMLIFAYALTDSFNQEHHDLHIKTKQLETFTNTLEQKVNERTNELQHAKEAIEKKEKQKTEAFTNISHEIKTPITIISNYLDKHINKHGATKELEIVQHNTNKLKRDMINVLDFEKLDKGLAFYDHSKITDISNIVRMNINMFYEIADRIGIKIKDNLEKNIYIKADPAAFDRVVNNLIDNAIKYTEENGQIDVLLKADNNNVELIVKDTGIGISEENKKHIFKPYFQVSGKKSNLQGIGMGLNIVKKIVDEIKGEIKAASKPNEGTEFKIRLKKYYLKEGDTVESLNHKIQKSSDLKNPIELKIETFHEDRPNIFIVEDNLEMLFYLQENLLNSFNVYYAVNGKEALEKLESITLQDIIISDIMMDEMDGYGFYEELLKKDKYKSIPFIFLTAKSSEHEKLNGLKKGAVDFIPKPFDINELIAKVKSLIRFRDALRDEKLDELSNQLHKLLSSGTKFKVVKKENGTQEKINQDSLFADYGISRRQVEIISLMENGCERKEIADKLGISINTVKTHIERLYRKFEVNNRVDLIKATKPI